VLGEIALTGRDHVRIHTYTAPEEGWRVNSHIIETATQLFVVDAQYMLPYAGEVVAHAAALGKPITRLYLTHFHPDHVLGAPAFSCPIYALGAVAAKIGAVGDRNCRRRAREAWRRHSGQGETSRPYRDAGLGGCRRSSFRLRSSPARRNRTCVDGGTF
jgi:glyoxylase-like metal-dependent hydrolase (beta-lactamase superfamily II)